MTALKSFAIVAGIFMAAGAAILFGMMLDRALGDTVAPAVVVGTGLFVVMWLCICGANQSD